MDGWDCLQDQEFLSLEGALFVARQMLQVSFVCDCQEAGFVPGVHAMSAWQAPTCCMQVSKPDNLPTPEFAIMKKYKDWEIRR